MTLTAEQAKLANYICSAVALAILLTRVTVSRHRQRPLDFSFWLVVLSIAVIVSRVVVVLSYLRYGTASDAAKDSHYFETHPYSNIEVGSVLTLVARILVTASYWLQICLLLLFYSHIMQGIKWVAHMIKITWVAIAITFVLVFLSTFLECQPFELYWQVRPDPGSCVKGYVQLLCQCISNIALDLLSLSLGRSSAVQTGHGSNTCES